MARSRHGRASDSADYTHSILLLCILLLATAVRMYRFGEVPGGLHQDEASLTYDAWSLLHFGIERNGFALPIILGAYGCGMSGTLAAYLLMPFIALLGLTPIAGRAVNLLGGLAAIPLLYLLARAMWDDRTALLAAFLLAISPWHIMQSRWGLDCNVFPPLFLLGTLLLVYAKTRPWLLLASLGVFGLSVYAYATAYFVVPLFLAGGAIYLFFHRKQFPLRTMPTLLGTGLFVLLALPIALYLAVNHWEWESIITPFFTIPRLPGIPRVAVATSLGDGHVLQSFVYNTATLIRLLVTQNDHWVENVIPRFGILYQHTMPLVLLGIGAALPLAREDWRRYRPDMFAFLWLVVALLLGVIMSVVIHRINILYFPLILFAAKGLCILRRWAIIFWPIIALYVVGFIGFTSTYFGPYAPMIGNAFSDTFDAAIRDAATSTAGDICVTTVLPMPDIRTLHALRIPPQAFFETVVYANPKGLYRTAASFDRFRFGVGKCDPETTAAYVIANRERGNIGTGWVARPYGQFSVLIRP